ncbi:MAG: DNA-3-methyladenine glycosylase [Chloroflexi bacterium]|nr:DNA-3-methyladenine glycosylase [Chloroflexota bacterium]MDA1228345.1 DNA-3-methyladenine glycosylase [Chloroflexota bacterium]
MKRASFSIQPVPPFDFDLTAGYLTYFRGRYATEVFEDGVYRRLQRMDGGLALLSVWSAGTIDAPMLEAEVRSDGLDEEMIVEARDSVAWLLGAHDDLTPFYGMVEDDPYLPPVVKGMHGLHIAHTATAYEALVLAILGQQISTHVARLLRNLITETYGESLEVDGELYRAFPSPQSLADAGVDGLRKIKFSQRKAEYIADISKQIVSGELDLESMRHQPAEDVVKALTKIRGIGPWTAHWLLIRSLGYADGFPHGDLAMERMMGMLVNGASPGLPMSSKEASAFSERWSPYRSYVTTYIFGAGRSGRFEELIKDHNLPSA